MLSNHEWRAAHPLVSHIHKSWRITSFLSPLEFMPWQRIAQEFADTDFGKNVFKLKNYVVKFLAEPFENRKEARDPDKYFSLSEKYEIGIIPPKVAILTIGADIQPDRIEASVVGWAEGLESWIIDHRVFHGSTASAVGEAFSAFHSWASTPFENEGGKKMKASAVGIDCRFSHYIEKDKTRNKAVFDFCYQANAQEGYERFHPVMGFELISGGEVVKKTVVRDHPVGHRIDVATATLKSELFDFYCEPSDDSHLIHFPAFSGNWFKGFFSEVYSEIRGKWAWKKIHARNEPLDTFIYSRAMAELLNLSAFDPEFWKDRRLDFFGEN